MKVFLISSNMATDPYPVYPLGMAVVAGAVQTAGHQVAQYDCLAKGEDPELLREALSPFAPDLICLSLRNIDNVDSFVGEKAWYLARARRLVDLLRRLSPAPIVLGGPALTIMPEAILDFLGADYAIVGEGEKALPELIDALVAGREVPRLIGRGRPLPGHQFSAPLYDPALVAYYLQQSGMLNLQTKRGCPFRCSYCSYPHLEGHDFRVRDPHQVVQELKQLRQEHGVERVFFTDSVFNDPQGHYLQLAEQMLHDDLRMQWTAFFRPQGMGAAELKLLKRAGLYALELGPDASSDQTLAGINKGLRFAEVLEVNRACLDARLPAAHYVMFGGPEEDSATLEEGLRNMQQLGASVVFAFSGIRIYPNSPLHLRAIEDGLLDPATSLLKPVYYFSPKIDRPLMEQRIQAAFAGQRNRIFPPSDGLERLAVMKGFGYRGLLWDHLVRFPKPAGSGGPESL